MGWWFGRKSAPADVRPFVPAWLGTGQEEGFARSVEGMALHVQSSGDTATYRSTGWEVGVLRGSSLRIGSDQVVGARAAAIADPTGGTKADPEARAAINAILAALRQHGLIAT